jgi:hypothetical protein
LDSKEGIFKLEVVESTRMTKEGVAIFFRKKESSSEHCF